MFNEVLRIAIGATVFGIIYTIATKTRKPKAHVNEDGALILQYDIATKWLVLLLAAAGAGVFLWFLFRAPLSLDFVIITIVFLVFVLIIVAPFYLLIGVFGTIFSLTSDGLSWHRFWAKDVFIKWEEIDSIYLSWWMGPELVMKTADRKIKIPLQLDGLKDLAEAIIDNLSYVKWKGVESALKELTSE